MPTKNARIATILAHDPGSHNYGVAVVRIQIDEGLGTKDVIDRVPFSLVYAGRMKSIFTSIKDSRLARQELDSFNKELHGIYEKFRPDVQIAERFMSRRMGGVTIELVNMLLGSLRVYSEQNNIPLRLIPASQWKNELKRRGVDLKDLYKKAKSIKRTPHELDAAFIAVYGAFKLMKVKPFNVRNPTNLAGAVLHKLGEQDCE